MGSLYKNGRVRSYILIVLAIISLAISAPIKNAVTKGVNDRINAFTTLLYENTGLKISYENLSPSILANFYIHNIKVYDRDSNQLLSINKTRVTYSIINLIKKNYQKGISNIVVDGIKLDIDEVLKIAASFESNKSSASSVNLSEIKKKIPENIKLKNIYLEYDDDSVSGLFTLKNISVNNSPRKKTVDIQTDSQINANIKSINKKISGKISATGSLTEKFDGSQLNVKFRDFTDGELRLNKLNLHVAYINDTVEVHTTQAVNPVFLGANYNLETGDINFQLRSEDLKPVALVNVSSRQVDLKKYRELTISTDTVINCNLKNKTLSYNCNTNAYAPDSIIPGGLSLSFSLYGDEKKAELSRFNVTGPHYNASSKLTYVYDKTQLSGFFELPELQLPNGNIVSTEIYFDPLDKGFMAFSPQLFVGEKSLTAIQLKVQPQSDSYDFSFEMSDYSHIEESEPGIFRLEGSYLNKSRYFLSNITLTSLYLGSIAGFVSQVLPSETAASVSSLQDTLSTYLLSGDVYVSTDLKNFSYNVPYILLANTKSDNQALMLSANGSDKNVQLNQLSLILGKYTLEATASVEQAPDSSDLFFTADINAASVPYHFTATKMPEVFTIAGDYGTEFEFRFGGKNKLNGHFLCESFPVKIMDKTIIISSNSDFEYDSENGPSIHLSHLELIDSDPSISISPKIVLSGNATRYGARLDSIAYTDLYSVLQGTADVMLNINENVFDSVGLNLQLKNPLSDESLVLDGSISNPDHLALDGDNLMKSLYLNLQTQLKKFSLNRFSDQKSDSNYVTGMIFASGTLEHPYVAFNVDSLSMILASSLFKAKGNIILEDRDVSLNELEIFYDDMWFRNLNAKASLTDMSLDATCDFDYDIMDETVHAPLVLTIGNSVIPEGGMLPDSFTATLSTKEFSGSFFKKRFPLSFSVVYANDIFAISSSQNGGFYGTCTKDGIVQFNLDNKSFLYAKLDGIIGWDDLNLELYDVEINLPKLCSYINLDDYMIIESGNFTGDFVLTGATEDPEVNGTAKISSPVARVPMVSKQKMIAPELNFDVINNEIQMRETLISVKGNRVLSSLSIFVSEWDFDHMEGAFKTYKNEQFPVNLNSDFLTLDGNVNADIKVYYEDDLFEVNGKISGENVELALQLLALSNLTTTDTADSEDGIMISTDLDITLGTHASVRLDPFLRCVFVPNTTMHVLMNQAENLYRIDGELKLKSGDIAYLNRSFYIKSGAIKFNKEDFSNPIITVTAETREKDENGQTVKIVMSAVDQYLLNLQPKFSSVPPKSENEILTLMGQIVMADSSSAADFLFAASDYAIQTTVMRSAENKLRDLLNFDIFSLRTNVLQNTYNMSVSKNLAKENISIGNFLDNTTVYIGKYLGSSLYIDAMVHFSFEDSQVNDITSAGKLLFQPEFGMELESPFANIRVNMAPDINALLLQNQFVPSTSVSLTWKYSF